MSVTLTPISPTSPRYNGFELRRFKSKVEQRATRPASALSVVSNEPTSRTASRVRTQIPKGKRFGEKGSLILDFRYTLKRSGLARQLYESRRNNGNDRPLSRSSVRSGSSRDRLTSSRRSSRPSSPMNQSLTIGGGNASKQWDAESNSVTQIIGDFSTPDLISQTNDPGTRSFCVNTFGLTRHMPEGRSRYEEHYHVSDSLSLRYLEGVVRDSISSAWRNLTSLTVMAEGEDKIRVKLKAAEVPNDLAFLAYMNSFLISNPHAIFYKMCRHHRTWHLKLEGHLTYVIQLGRTVGTPTDAAAIIGNTSQPETSTLWHTTAQNVLK